MNIKSVSEITGLTKKAIKYYEEEGLIAPEKNKENGYREYDLPHVERLNLISTLRALGISIEDIKNGLKDKDNLNLILSNKLSSIDDTIELLKNTKVILKEIIDENLELDKTSKNILKLKEILSLTEDQQGILIKDKLLEAFPGNFGRLVVTNYLPFLNISLDSEEKKKAFLDMVNYLDEVEEFSISEEMEQQLKLIKDEEFYRKTLEARQAMIEAVCSGEGEQFENFKKTVLDSMKRLEDTEFRNFYIENKKRNKGFTEALKEKGYYDKVVNNLRIINPKYEEFCSKLEKLNDSLGLAYGEDGIPYIKEKN